MAVLSKGNKFPEIVVSEMFSKVRGKSTLAKLSDQIPVSFNGNSIFTFAMDGDISIVAENGQKPSATLVAEPVKVQPIKVVYQSRVSDEFMNASEEAQLEVLDAFAEGFAKKLASGLDKMGMHGINPATGTTSPLITSYIDQNANNVVYVAGQGDKAIEDAVALLGDYDVTGVALSKTLASAMAQETDGNGKKFPELAWGGQPNAINGVSADVNSTVSVANDDLAIVGDFSAFKWGYAKDVMLETIEFGDPDQTGVDLKANNQIMLRAEAFIGFAVLDSGAFARVTSK